MQKKHCSATEVNGKMLRKPGLDKTCESLQSYPKGYRGRPLARTWAETVTDLFAKNPNKRHSQGSTRQETLPWLQLQR